jgi:hypothetical protein
MRQLIYLRAKKWNDIPASWKALRNSRFDVVHEMEISSHPRCDGRLLESIFPKRLFFFLENLHSAQSHGFVSTRAAATW